MSDINKFSNSRTIIIYTNNFQFEVVFINRPNNTIELRITLYF